MKNQIEEGFRSLRFNMIPGQENIMKKRFESFRFRRDISQLHQLQKTREKLAPIQADAPDIARIIMKEQTRGKLVYQRNGGNSSANEE